MEKRKVELSHEEYVQWLEAEVERITEEFNCFKKEALREIITRNERIIERNKRVMEYNEKIVHANDLMLKAAHD